MKRFQTASECFEGVGNDRHPETALFRVADREAHAVEKLGCLTVPAAAGNTKRQIKFITDFGTTCLHIIPSYATRLAEVMYEMGLDPRRDTKLHTVCIGAEPHYLQSS